MVTIHKISHEKSLLACRILRISISKCYIALKAFVKSEAFWVFIVSPNKSPRPSCKQRGLVSIECTTQLKILASNPVDSYNLSKIFSLVFFFNFFFDLQNRIYLYENEHDMHYTVKSIFSDCKTDTEFVNL